MWPPLSASCRSQQALSMQPTKKMKIGIIGSGHVGSALGGVWAKAGNEVMFSSRNLDNDKKLAAEVGANAHAGTPQEAAAFGQVILLRGSLQRFSRAHKEPRQFTQRKSRHQCEQSFPATRR